MAHSESFRRLTALTRAALRVQPPSRRAFLATASAPLLRAVKPRTLDVGIVGAGLAGLVCADSLARYGVAARLYEASARPGGRCFSLRNFFPGQTAERGGEFIDTGHKTMIGLARRFRLSLVDVAKDPGSVRYYFNGQVYPESAVVAEYRALVQAMRADLRRLSSSVTAHRFTPADEAFDHMSLEEYLTTRNAGPLIKAVLAEAYIAEYGLEPSAQSCLNFLFFIHADRRSKFRPFGVFSDERYHLPGGNDAIAQGLAASLPGAIHYGRQLTRVARTSDGRIELNFTSGSSALHDAVVLTLHFTVLRHITLDSSLNLSPSKQNAIANLGYGANVKMMLGFSSRPWLSLHASNGSSYSDLAHHQATWETDAANATASRAVITDYSGGLRGAALNPGAPQSEAHLFATALDRVYPGALSAATKDAVGNYRVHLEHWPSNPLTRGSYTCYRPGQFTTIAGHEPTPAGNLLFAGEHTNSFYEWQGFMEGACLSGLAAAAQLLA
jgi:monoamine oxidase